MERRFVVFAMAGFVVIAFAGWLTGWLLVDDVHGFDRAVARLVSEHRTSALDRAMRWATVLGGVEFLFASALAASGYAIARYHDFRWPAFLMLAVTGGIVLPQIVKPLVGRPRPHIAPVVEVVGHAWPSGHATGAAALAVALALMLATGRPRARRVAIWSVAATVAVVVAASRVYLGVHWTSDTAAGLLMGAAWARAAGAGTLGPRASWRSGGEPGA